MDGNHITNVMEEDFENILLDAAGTCRNIVSSEGEKAGLLLYTFDPVAVIHGEGCLWEKEKRQYCNRPAARTSAGGDAGARMDCW